MAESNARPVPEEGSTCTPASRRQTLPSDAIYRTGRRGGESEGERCLPPRQPIPCHFMGTSLPLPPGAAARQSPRLPFARRASLGGCPGHPSGSRDAFSRRVARPEWRLKTFLGCFAWRGEAIRCKGRKEGRTHICILISSSQQTTSTALNSSPDLIGFSLPDPALYSYFLLEAFAPLMSEGLCIRPFWHEVCKLVGRCFFNYQNYLL